MNQMLKTTFLLTTLTLILVAMGGAIGGKSGMLVAFLVAGGMNFFAYWNSDKIVLRMYNARQVTREESPDFYGLVENLAHKAGMPMPKVYVIPSDSPNAFATGRNPENAAVAATQGIMRILSRDNRVESVALGVVGDQSEWLAVQLVQFVFLNDAADASDHAQGVPGKSSGYPKGRSPFGQRFYRAAGIQGFDGDAVRKI